MTTQLFNDLAELDLYDIDLLIDSAQDNINWYHDDLEKIYANTEDTPANIVDDFYCASAFLYTYRSKLVLYQQYKLFYESALSHYQDSLENNRRLGELLAQ